MILTAQQQRDWDAYTIAKEPIAPIDLMERASRRWFEHARPYLTNSLITVFAGFGNNGGDALAIARFLDCEGYQVRVVMCLFGKTLSKDAKTNLERLPLESVSITRLEKDIDLENLQIRNDGLIVDGVFGTGLRTGIHGRLAEVVRRINKSDAVVLSIDVPSGLLIDAPNAADDQIVRANTTISFQAAKLSFLLPENAPYVGEHIVIDVGLDPTYSEQLILDNSVLDEHFARSLAKKRAKFSHKGSYGHSVIVQGVSSTLGASLLAARAAMCAGSGLTTILSEEANINLSHPELMISSLDSLKDLNKKTFCIGPGLGTNGTSQAKLVSVLDSTKNPVVLDADALNIIAAEPELFERIPALSILTPHPKELERLIGSSINSFEQLEKAKAFAIDHNIVLLIKRAHTVVIASDGKAYFNTTGNNGLAKGGSGDVLSGVICALLAQGYSPLSSALLGVYIHGMAADLALEVHSPTSMTPNLIITFLSKAFRKLGI